MKKIAVILGAFIMLASYSFAEDNGNVSVSKTVKLNSGYEMPVLGLGTWTLTGKTCEDAVYAALKVGYRLIDTAKYYGNEKEVGNAVARAVRDGICGRDDIFITTKIVPWTSNAEKDIEDSLAKLGVEYIDLCLLHQSGGRASDDKVYIAMEKYAKRGKIRSIGISNFYTPASVNHFIEDFEIKPAVIQNENHIFCQGTALRDYCRKFGIYVESYYPFGGRGHTKENLGNPVITQIATAHKKTAAQIIVRWHLQAGFIAIPGSSNPSHIAENFSVWDFELSDDEMRRIAALNRNRRYESW